MAKRKVAKKKVKRKRVEKPKALPMTLKKSMGMKEIVKYIEAKGKDKKYKFKKEYVGRLYSHMAAGGTLGEFAHEIKVHRNTVELWLKKSQYGALKDACDEGCSEFLQELPAKLLEHMQQGFSFESFPGTVNRSISWAYELLAIMPTFQKAKDIGYTKSMHNHEALLNAQAAGKLMRQEGEKIKRDEEGRKMYDEDGEPIMIPRFVPTLGSAHALKFAMQNRFEEYKPDATGNQEKHDELKKLMDAHQELERQGK